MATIWKYPFEITDEFAIDMPGGNPLHVGVDPIGQLCLWALVEPDAAVVTHQFRLYGTGHDVPMVGMQRYVGTVHQRGFVWHLFEKTSG